MKHAPRNVLALRAANRDNGANQDKPVGEAIQAERLARYGRLMLQMAEEKRVSEAIKAALLGPGLLRAASDVPSRAARLRALLD